MATAMPTAGAWQQPPASAALPEARSSEAFCAAVSEDYEPFSDIGGNIFASVIECAAFIEVARGGPSGLRTDLYGPSLTTNRAQMASLVARLMDKANALDHRAAIEELPSYDGIPAFADVLPDSPHFEAVNRLQQVGIVTGGPGGRLTVEYGPDLPVTREQMASFVNRAFGFLTGTALSTQDDYFTDDEGSAHEDNINAIASEGIVIGDGARAFAPRREIRRDQVTAFLVRALSLLHSDGHIVAAERDGEPGTIGHPTCEPPEIC